MHHIFVFVALFAVVLVACRCSGTSFREKKQPVKYQIPPQFEAADMFREGLAPVKKDGKWGFIDTKGRFRIDPSFEPGDQEDRKTIFVLKRKKKKPRVSFFDHMPMGEYRPDRESPYVFYPGKSRR